ncbi:hypothetical protein [Tardiphaga sp. 841_E9_N1_2]|uniref:hypothetical protein n=1 Tax=Tardiphaga sp. 841_E9_N1_2 TaxID=3240762 RepID=UPI003F213177
MTKMDRTRPTLRLIDDSKRQRFEPSPPKTTQQDCHPSMAFDELSSKIDFESLIASGEELSRNFHGLACSVLAQIEKNGNVRLVNSLIAAASASTDTNQLRLWFSLFGPVEFVDGKAKYKPHAQTMIEAAMATPFWTIKPDE